MTDSLREHIAKREKQRLKETELSLAAIDILHEIANQSQKLNKMIFNGQFDSQTLAQAKNISELIEEVKTYKLELQTLMNFRKENALA